MAKGEGRRRRLDHEAAAASAATDTQIPVGLSVDEEAQSSLTIPSPVRRRARAPSGMQPASDNTQPAATGNGNEPSAAPTTKPVALAEILANPSLSLRPLGGAAAPEPVDEIPQIEPTRAPEPAQFHPSFAQPARTPDPDKTREESGTPAPAETPPPFAPAYGDERERPTREPVILALLFAAVIMLAFNTYFTFRLNGLYDRLSAIADRTTSAPAATGDRPWVGVDSIKTAPFASGGQPVTNVHIVNSGKEPAYDLRSNTVGSLRSSATSAPDVPAQKGPLATTGLLLPNTGGNLTFFANTRALTAAEAESVQSGQYVLWLAGRLDYKDARGRTHVTTFRYRYNAALNGFIAAPDGNLAN